jgi:MoaA/NifB/PqqE/SkfB family radical SAM enzyme
MDLETLDSIIIQGKDLGIHFFLFSGGKPLIRKKDIITLCERHSDCAFLAFTNGTLIDDGFADEMLRVKNFVPAISVEGFESETALRRGQGTFARVDHAMEILKRKKLAFGLSCCYTSLNTETIGSEEYFDWMVEKGAKFVWLFTYIPVGHSAHTNLMVSAEQRVFMMHQVRKFRETKPIFSMDFWNDGEYVEGCIAGGRRFLHINANGDIEPCAFIHYSDSNIKEKTLLEAFQSPLFMAYHNSQPFNHNHLRPCPLLDNPNALVSMVESSGAHSTDISIPEYVCDLAGKCYEKAAKWAEVSDPIWESMHGPL